MNSSRVMYDTLNCQLVTAFLVKFIGAEYGVMVRKLG